MDKNSSTCVMERPSRPMMRGPVQDQTERISQERERPPREAWELGGKEMPTHLPERKASNGAC